MSASYRYPIVCACGHKGFECLSEWGHWDAHESYSPEGLERGSVEIGQGVATITGADGAVSRSSLGHGFNVLVAMHPTCECGRVGAVRGVRV
jgi:hypothetical protein